jgi:hypothetical protein
MALKKIIKSEEDHLEEVVDWIYLAQDMEQWRYHLNKSSDSSKSWSFFIR